MENNLLSELTDWAENLLLQYRETKNEQESAHLMKKCADFLDTFIQRANEI